VTVGVYNGTANRRTSSGTFAAVSQSSEEWFYNCGPNNLNTYLTFEGSALTNIRLGYYGKGESYCNGAEQNPNNTSPRRDVQAQEKLSINDIARQKEKEEEEEYQARMKRYNDRIKELDEEAAKARASHEASMKKQEEEQK
jgi:hypothetical protein